MPFDTTAFLPHAFCFVGRQDLILLHVVSDAIIALAYFMIPVTLLVFMRRRRVRISFNWAIGLFAAFIVLCGLGHVVDIVTVWYPVYYAQGWLRAATALVSILTALAIIPLVPRLLAMRSPEELEAANDKLRAEVARRESAERNLRQSLADVQTAVKELEQFAYITSHDLQAPLRNIAGFSQLLATRHRARLDGDALEFLGYIEQGTRHMQHLINDLLQLSRVGRSEAKFEKKPLAESFERARRALSSQIDKCGAQIDCAVLPELTADHTLLTQLFQNLLGNAIKFHAPGKTPSVTVRCEREAEGWHLVVADDGIGIPPEQLENVFAVFRRLHAADEYEGTGIGLAICRKIVAYHGGRIWAESSGQGTSFHVVLPADPATRPAVASTRPPDVPAFEAAPQPA